MLILPLFRRQPKTKNVVSGTEIVIVIRTVNASVAAAVKNKISKYYFTTVSQSNYLEVYYYETFTRKKDLQTKQKYYFHTFSYDYITGIFHTHTHTHLTVLLYLSSPKTPLKKKFNLYPLTFDLTSKNENKITLINLLQAVPLFT